MATTQQNRFVKVDGAFVRPGSQQPAAVNAPRQLSPQQTMQQNDPGSLQNFQQANPGLTFNQQDMSAYNAAGAAPTPPAAVGAAPGATPPNPFETGDYSKVTDPHDAFNVLLFDLLKRAQGVDTTQLLQRKRELQRAAVGEVNNPNVSDISTLSPDQQSSIRSGNTNALSVEIDQNAADIAKSEAAMKNFENVYQQSQAFGKDFADNMVAPDSVIAHYKAAIESNPDNLSIILSGVNDKTKQKIIQGLDYTKLKKKGEDLTKLLSVDDAAKLGLPYGTTLGGAIKAGKTPASPGGDKIGEQNQLDYQTVDSAYQTIKAVASKYGKTPDTLTAEDTAKFTDTDGDAVAKALARIQNPDISRAGGDAGNALSPTSASEKVTAFTRQTIGGQKYLPQKLLDAVQTANQLHSQRAGSIGVGSGTIPGSNVTWKVVK